ncbi:MAG: aconitate hydratase [Calditrichaeota bacterium]|nr:aconitate hydratase [Calditrichota bacterium]
MACNVTQKLIEQHLLEGKMKAGEEIALKIDQTLTQDATGTLVMLEFEAMGLPKVKTEISAQYVDHNLLQNDFKNADDHIFLRSACKKFGVWFSPPGNGVSHPLHMEYFGKPGKTLLGSDSHSCAAGSMGMLAMGAGGLEVAMAMAGKPFYVKMPQIWGIRLSGQLPDWVSAKDIILEMLRRFDVAGGVGRIIEYYGPGLEQLSAMDRHVIANMGAELGATTTVFPADEAVKTFLKDQQRAGDWTEILADKDAEYDIQDEINLSELQPLIALPGSPGNVVPVAEVAGEEIYQAMIGSSANPGLRDFIIPSMIAKDHRIHDRVSLDINPTSRQILETLSTSGYLSHLIRSGARIHQSGCNGCIGMGQAPATDKISLRTVPRNFPGRSGTKEDKVYLCSPETAIVSAIRGEICDPRTMDMDYPEYIKPEAMPVNKQMLHKPSVNSNESRLEKGPNIKPLPEFNELSFSLEAPVLLKTGDNISTDEILPAGSRVLPFRSNIPEISKFTFYQLDSSFYSRALNHKKNGFIIIAGSNYGQGSSREHAALAPRYLGLKAVIAKSFARIHFQNLANFGILPLLFNNPSDYNKNEQGDVIVIDNLHAALADGKTLKVHNYTKRTDFNVKHNLSPRQAEMILQGSLINVVKNEQKAVA